MKAFDGRVLFLDRSDINTDEIIPARYLTEITKEALGPHLMEDLELPGFDPRRDLRDRRAIVARANFGCGSSREHAPWALEANGIHLVAAASHARIFRQNMFNCGMMALELPEADIEALFRVFEARDTRVAVDLEAGTLRFSGEGEAMTVPLVIGDFDRELVKAGGWVEYADARY